MPTTDCVPQLDLRIQALRPVRVTFDGPATSSDGGWLLLRGVDDAAGVTGALAGALHDRRDPDAVTHELPTLVRQRVLQIAAGYADANDATTLRHDPLLRLVCGRDPDGVPLASQPTLSRLETGATARDVVRAQRAHEARWVAGLPADLRTLVLDIDGTDDPTHGQQQFAFYNGHYGSTIYAPLLVFDQFGALATARLRGGRDHGARYAASTLTRLIRAARARFPDVRVIVRGDAGFGVASVVNALDVLGATLRGVDYVLGVAPNAALRRGAAPAVARAARVAATRCDGHARCYDAVIYQSETWARAHRVVVKAERIGAATDVRCVATTFLHAMPREIYAGAYAPRGDAENRIKDFKRAVAADRLSCHGFVANALRLQLHAAAYALLHALRARLDPPAADARTPRPRVQLDTLRVQLLKVAATVRRTARRVWVTLSRAFPAAAQFRALAAAFLAPPAAAT